MDVLTKIGRVLAPTLRPLLKQTSPSSCKPTFSSSFSPSSFRPGLYKLQSLGPTKHFRRPTSSSFSATEAQRRSEKRRRRRESNGDDDDLEFVIGVCYLRNTDSLPGEFHRSGSRSSETNQPGSSGVARGHHWEIENDGDNLKSGTGSWGGGRF